MATWLMPTSRLTGPGYSASIGFRRMPAIELDGLERRYGERTALAGVSAKSRFDFERRAWWAGQSITEYIQQVSIRVITLDKTRYILQP